MAAIRRGRGIALAALLCPALAAADGLPGWLAGHWVLDEDRYVEEVWLAPRDGLMLGMSRTTGGGKKPFFEFVRIEKRDAGIFYVAQPGGRTPPTEFRLVSSSATELVFENPLHDFPQRVRYRRDGGDAVVASIEGKQDGEERVETWRYARDAGDP
jgi:hypothetical protein